ncbi:MAG TPA: hypothetical protein VHZ51_00080, partial [Ktedonobacteraceae bacterium]|nr:hypothetical protein [Ktedonobacteraceae bacterium]
MQLRKPYLPVVKKVRITQEQKHFTNFVQKSNNVRNAFMIDDVEAIADRTLLLIDNIYDFWCIMQEIAMTLKQAGASVIFYLTT